MFILFNLSQCHIGLLLLFSSKFIEEFQPFLVNLKEAALQSLKKLTQNKKQDWVTLVSSLLQILVLLLRLAKQCKNSLKKIEV
jgi:hypothetical protein